LTVRLILDLSTHHLPEELGSTGLDTAPGVIGYATDHGWLMWVPNDPDDSAAAMDEDLPPEVLKVQQYSRERGCDWVLFDAGGHETEDLPRWEW
jgi:hypothetical protein